MKRWFLMLAAVLTVVFTIAGCSGGNQGSASTTVAGSSQTAAMSNSQSQPSESESGSTGQKIKPGQLISQAEAATLLGAAVKDGVSAENPLLSLSVCFYSADNPASKDYLQIALIQKSQGGQSEQGGQPSESASSQPSESASSQPSASQSGGQNEGMPTKGLYEALKMLFSDPNTPITGRLGDDAFIATQGTGILYKEYFIYVSAGSATPDAAKAIVAQAGELAVENIMRLLGE